MNRPHPDIMEPSAVDRWLLEANERLGKAEAVASDRAVRDAIRAARKALKPAIERARHILDDERLRGARQQDLPL